MTTVRQILESKTHGLLSIPPDASVFDALRKMADHDVGALVVLDEGRLVGVFSERDYARKIILSGKSSRATQVRKILMEEVPCVRRDNTVDECMALMTDKRVRHVPVLEGDQVVGIVSIGDLVKEKMSHQQFVIDELEHYIHS